MPNAINISRANHFNLARLLHLIGAEIEAFHTISISATACSKR